MWIWVKTDPGMAFESLNTCRYRSTGSMGRLMLILIEDYIIQRLSNAREYFLEAQYHKSPSHSNTKGHTTLPSIYLYFFTSWLPTI
jgi:hypothetical protein